MSALLSLDAVSYRYWRGQRPVPAVEEITFDLEPGELGGIWGDRGAGKTTLAKIVAGLLSPDRGEVAFDGRPLPSGMGVLHPGIGFASRRGPLLEDLTVEEWIATTLLDTFSWRQALSRARLALSRVGAEGIGGAPWADLSDSERMLAAIAHAIVRGPRLLVVDDPVAGLGILGRATVMELLREVADHGVAVLMTAADVSELHGANRLWALDAGRLDGPPARPMGTVVPLRGA
jgi:ABC-type multidrug transport system ATPase subunit